MKELDKLLIQGIINKHKDDVPSLTMEEYLKQVDEFWKPETDPEK